MQVRNKIITAAIALLSICAIAATKGDPTPFALYGVSQIAGYDAGTGAPICVGVSAQNTVMVRNYPRDGGSSTAMYCGFDTSVTPTTGMPVLANEVLSVDMVVVNNFTSTTNGPFDGGTFITVGVPGPKLCCIEAPGGAISDFHWMIVK